jgi:hypothetical protein
VFEITKSNFLNRSLIVERNSSFGFPSLSIRGSLTVSDSLGFLTPHPVVLGRTI